MSGQAQVTPGVLQSAAQTATITGSVLQSDGTPVAGADIRLTGPGAHLTTVSDVHGAFVFISVPYGTYRIDASAPNIGTASRDNVVVKSDSTLAIQYVAQTGGGLKEIARVSTHSSGANINVTPASIASVNPSDYAFQGNTSWKELLDQIPGVTVGGDLYQGRASGTSVVNGPTYPIVLSIDGALPYETSVTLDGMPLESQSLNATPGTGADLSYLPMTTFDTADVVRGPGADAPSIVDSIGGSFVLHAPGPVDKNSYEFSFSNDPYGGTVANAKVALRFGRLSATIVYGMDNSPGPLEGGITPLRGAVPTGLLVNGQAFSAVTSSSFAPLSNFASSLFFYGGSWGSAWTQHSGAVALSYNVTPSITAQVFYAGTSSNQYTDDELATCKFIPGASYVGSLVPGKVYTIQGGTPKAFLWPQSSSLLEEKITAYIGGGVLRLAALQGSSRDGYAIAGSAEGDNGYYILNGTGYYASAPSTPVTFNRTSAYLTFPSEVESEESWSNNRDLLVSYARQMGSKSTLGISYVKSYYNDPEASSYISSTFVDSFDAASAVSEATDEWRLQGSTQISDKLSLDASWYVARGGYHIPNPYVSDTSITCPGGVFTYIVGQPSAYEDSIFSYSAPRLGATWRTNHDMVIRAAAGGGFALPQLSYLVGSSDVPSCPSGATYCTVSLTNLNLQPEKSFGFDLGTDLRLHRDTVLSFDLYRVNLYGQFFSSASTTGTCPTCGGLPLYTTEEGNLSQSRMEGINIDVRHDVPRGIYWHGALGLTRGYVVSVPAGFYNTATCMNCANQYIIPGMNYDGYFQSTVPYANGSATIGYRWEPGKYVDLSPTYYGSNNQYYRPAFMELDAHMGYPLTKNVSLLATFQNITGMYDQSQELAFTCPCLTAPVIAGAAQEFSGLYGLPYGPRAVTVTLQLH